MMSGTAVKAMFLPSFRWANINVFCLSVSVCFRVGGNSLILRTWVESGGGGTLEGMRY